MRVILIVVSSLFLFACSTPEIYNNSYQPDADQMERHDNDRPRYDHYEYHKK